MVDDEGLIESIKITTDMIVNAVSDGDPGAVVHQLDGIEVEELKRQLDRYPYLFARPPLEVYDDLCIVEEPNAQPRTWHITVRLWTQEEGPSRLVLKLKSVQFHPEDTIVTTRVVGLNQER